MRTAALVLVLGCVVASVAGFVVELNELLRTRRTRRRPRPDRQTLAALLFVLAATLFAGALLLVSIVPQ